MTGRGAERECCSLSSFAACLALLWVIRWGAGASLLWAASFHLAGGRCQAGLVLSSVVPLESRRPGLHVLLCCPLSRPHTCLSCVLSASECPAEISWPHTWLSCVLSASECPTEIYPDRFLPPPPCLWRPPVCSLYLWVCWALFLVCLRFDL